MKRRNAFLVIVLICLVTIFIILITNVRQHTDQHSRLIHDEVNEYKRELGKSHHRSNNDEASSSPENDHQATAIVVQHHDNNDDPANASPSPPARSGRPDHPSKILVLSSSVGLRHDSKSYLQHARSNIDLITYPLTEYVRNEYAKIRGYSYALESDEIVLASSRFLSDYYSNNNDIGAVAVNTKDTNLNSPAHWARVSILDKYLSSENNNKNNAAEWIVWMSVDTMIMNVDFEIEAILENIPQEVDLVIGVNQLEPAPQTFVNNNDDKKGPPADQENNAGVITADDQQQQQNNNNNNGIDNLHHDSRYMIKNAAGTMKSRKKFAVDPGVMFFRASSYDTFAKPLLDRVSKLIKDSSFTKLCPTIPKSRGERGAWQCVIANERRKANKNNNNNNNGDSTMTKRNILVVKNQKLFNSFFLSATTDDDQNENSKTSSFAYSAEEKDFIARLPPTTNGVIDCSTSTKRQKKTSSTSSCYVDVAKEAFALTMKQNHLDMKEFKKLVPVFERRIVINTDDDENNKIISSSSSNPKKKKKRQHRASSIGVLSVMFTASSSSSSSLILFDVLRSHPFIFEGTKPDPVQQKEFELRRTANALSQEYCNTHHYDRIHEVVNVLPSGVNTLKRKLLPKPIIPTMKGKYYHQTHHPIVGEEDNNNNNNINHDDQQRQDKNSEDETNRHASRHYQYATHQYTNVPSKRIRKAVEIAKLLLKHLPQHDWIYLLPTDAFIFELDTSLEKLLLIDLEEKKIISNSNNNKQKRAAADGQEKNGEEEEEEEEAYQKDLIITKQLKTATVSEDTFFIRHSRWSMKILREFIEKFEPHVDLEVDHHASDDAYAGASAAENNNKNIRLDTRHKIAQEFKGGFISTIAKSAVDDFWKSKKIQQQTGNEKKNSAIKSQQQENNNNNNNDDDDGINNKKKQQQHLVVSSNNNHEEQQQQQLETLHHVYFVPDQHLFNSFIFPTDRGHQLSARYNQGNSDFLGRLARCYALDLVNDIDDEHNSNNHDMAKNSIKHKHYYDQHMQQQQREEQQQQQNEDNNNNNIATTIDQEDLWKSGRKGQRGGGGGGNTNNDNSNNKKNKNNAAHHHQTKHPSDQQFTPDFCYKNADRLFDKALTKRYPSVSDRTSHKEALIEKAHISTSLNIAYSDSSISISSSSQKQKQSHHLNNNNDDNDSDERKKNKNFNKEISWKKTQPGVKKDDLKIDSDSDNDNHNNKKSSTTPPLSVPDPETYRTSSSTAILTVLCSSVASVHEDAQHAIDTDMERAAARDLEENILPLHRQSFESKLAYAQLHGYDVIVEDCSVLENSPQQQNNNINDNNNNNADDDDGLVADDKKNKIRSKFASMREYRQWAKLLAVMKWINRYDRILVVDAGIVMIDFDKSLDDIETTFKQIRSKAQKGNKEHHQDPILMVSSDIEGVSTASMLWKNVNSNDNDLNTKNSNNNRNKISTNQLLLQLLTVASSSTVCPNKHLHADKSALRCLLNHAIKKKSTKNINNNDGNNNAGAVASSSTFSSLDAHSAIIVDTRDEDRFLRRRGAAAHGTMRLLFSIPKNLMPIAIHDDHDFRFRHGDFAVFLMNCYTKLGAEACDRIVSDFKVQSHDLNQYGRIVDAEKQVPLLLKPKEGKKNRKKTKRKVSM